MVSKDPPSQQLVVKVLRKKEENFNKFKALNTVNNLFLYLCFNELECSCGKKEVNGKNKQK